MKKFTKDFFKISINAWLFFGILTYVFDLFSDRLFENSQINSKEYNWFFISDTLEYFINIPYFVYFFGYLILRLLKIKTDKKLTFLHLIFFIISLILMKIYLINFNIKLFFVFSAFLLFAYNIYKSVFKK